MLITLKHKIVVGKFVKKIMVKKTLFYWIDICDICCRCTLELPMRQLQCVLTTYVTENKETNFEIYIYQEPFPLKHLNLPISIKILVPVTIWQIVYIYMTAISPNLIS